MYLVGRLLLAQDLKMIGFNLITWSCVSIEDLIINPCTVSNNTHNGILSILIEEISYIYHRNEKKVKY